MRPRVLEKRIEAAGWVEQKGRGKGGHRVYLHPERPGIVVIPLPRR